MEKICGIYKITNPNGKVYIGQSINIERRKFLYSKLYCKTQIQLYNSLNKHGWDNHIFEIIEQCDECMLLEREIYWKQHYLDLFNNDFSQVLFSQLNDGKGGKRSEQTKQKIGLANSKPKPEGFGDMVSKTHKGRTRSDQTKQNMSKAHKGHPRYNDEWRKSISNALKGKPKPYQNKIVNQFTLEGDFIRQYESINQASQISGVRVCTISFCCNGKYETGGGYIWKFEK